VLEVREVTPEEFEEAGRVTALAYREFATTGSADWDGYLRQLADVEDRAGRTTVLVAVEDGAILGTATLEIDGRVDAEEEPPLDPDEAHIRMLGVDPATRGRGVASALMRECLARARQAGRARITLNTTHRMEAAQAMYGSMGFARKPDRVFPDGFVLLTYELAL
jgi:ribosomal protein S18 acetylase RimI-like enzyme